ncbi:putative phosphodiesterase [Rhizomicrobium palustre]|uniref:Putative phosphodiesterase n=2 Tax=Rhizomicrobium palustre TaxID=189966 RepID=A0A846MVD3_9PROT|nr:putative phosphodiesterase [Rhizomicrobium palustre]
MFRIGVIADAQYADKDDEPPRLYRRAPAKIAEAVETLNHAGIDFAVHLGDFIDGDAKNFDTVLPLTAKFTCPLHSVLGNHDFAVAEDLKPSIAARLGMPTRYYSFEHKDWIFVVLDGNDLSTYGWPHGSAEDVASRKLKAERYPDAPNWDGGLGAAQLAWLEGILAAADRAGKRVALLCHFPIFPENPHNLWNAKDVISLISPHPCVKLWLNGHNHDGNYGVVSGIHCVNLKGMLDTEETAYAVLAFYADHIALKGYGRQPDLTLALR